MIDDEHIIYVSPKSEVIEQFAKSVCQGLADRGKPDFANPEVSQGFAHFLRVLFGIQAKQLNGELKN